MLCKTAAQVTAALDAVHSATGTSTLAAETVRDAMQESLKLALPDELPQSGPAAVAQVKADLLAAGLPTDLVCAAFEDANGANLPPPSVDANAIATYIGMQVSIAHIGKLANSVRMRKEMVYGPAGNSGPGARSTGAAGGNRRSAVNKLVMNRLKQKRSELWAWVKQYVKKRRRQNIPRVTSFLILFACPHAHPTTPRGVHRACRCGGDKMYPRVMGFLILFVCPHVHPTTPGAAPAFGWGGRREPGPRKRGRRRPQWGGPWCDTRGVHRACRRGGGETDTGGASYVQMSQ